MFASVDLAARIDHAEAGLSAACGRAVLAQDGTADAFVEQIGGGVAVYTGPASPMNKMIGVGFAGRPSDQDLVSIEDRFGSRRAPLQAEVATLADPSFAALLSRRGYVLENFENVLGRPVTSADGAAPIESAIHIRLMQRDEAAQWMDAAITGFQHADEKGVHAPAMPPREVIEQALRPYGHMNEFRRYCALVDGQLAGIATLRLQDGIAQLCGAATLPPFRRRGIQTMLLRRRLADAFRDGCGLAVLTTQPGSTSQENGYRQGFSLLYSRAHLVKHPT
jgi:hypothetical protein